MSAEAIGWVFRHSPYKHGAFDVHLSLADAANDLHDNQVWFGVDRLAAKARVGRSTVIAALGQMEADQMLEEAARQRGPASPTVYRMLFPEDAPIVYHDGTSPKSEPVYKSDQSKKGPELVQNPESSPLTNPKEPKGVSRSTSRSIRIPEDFTVTDEMREWASAKGIRSSLTAETERFVDYYVAKGDTRVIWVAAWRNWMRNADKYLDNHPDPSQSKSAAARARVRAQLDPDRLELPA